MSFMLIRDQRQVVDRVKAWLKPGGRIIFFQTVFKDRSRLMEIIKPRLKYITSIDFGSVTYEKELIALLKEKKLAIVEDRHLKKTWYRGEYRMLVTSPEAVPAASRF
jgi:alpha-N-acetylglucosaminidase